MLYPNIPHINHLNLMREVNGMLRLLEMFVMGLSLSLSIEGGGGRLKGEGRSVGSWGDSSSSCLAAVYLMCELLGCEPCRPMRYE